jgi:hypothetical protein
MTYYDYGIRCDRHIGEVFPPRCPACEGLAAEWGTLPNTVCPKHPAHLRPCTKCNP